MRLAGSLALDTWKGDVTLHGGGPVKNVNWR
jgi:hypothetical protein